MWSVVIFPEDGVYVAQCLEVDINAPGDTPEKAWVALDYMFLCNKVFDIHEGRKPLSSWQQAPRWYWALFDKGMPFGTERRLAGDAVRVRISPSPS